MNPAAPPSPEASYGQLALSTGQNPDSPALPPLQALWDNRAAQELHGQDDVAQCIHIILQTPKGADPLRPTFGCDAWRFIDAPLQLARPHIVREVFEALTRWEPRIKVQRVVVQAVTIEQPQQVECRIVWSWAAEASSLYETQLPLTRLAAGGQA